MTDNKGGSSESSQGSDDPFDIVLDEDFVKGAAAKEPSARARELSARWSQEPPEPTGWRSDTPDPLQRVELQEDRPARRRRVWPRNLTIAVVTAAVVGYLVYPRPHSRTPLNATPAGTLRPWTQTPSPEPSPSFTNPDDRYFADSPSLSWADNEAGLVAPAAAAVGSFPASEVAAGYDGLKKLLAAGNLDATILNGGPITDFTSLLDSRSNLPGDLPKWISHPGYDADATNVITRFNPTTTALLGHIVKVQGSMSAAIDKDGFLTVTGDYKFVYAVGPGNGSGGPSRAVVHRVYVIRLATPGAFEPQTGKYLISEYTSEVANTACNDYNGYLNPSFGTGGGTSGKTVDPYASSNLLGVIASPSPTGTASPPCDIVSRL